MTDKELPDIRMIINPNNPNGYLQQQIRPGLDLRMLRMANRYRRPAYRNARGEPVEPYPNLSGWSNAALGELGEAANLIAKLERGDFSLDEVRDQLAAELADALVYLDLLATAAGIDLSDAVVEKWNEVSERIGYRGRLIFEDGDYVFVIYDEP